jgi:hypothetical protein
MSRFKSFGVYAVILLGAGALGPVLGAGSALSQKDAKMVERWIKDVSPGVIEFGGREGLDHEPVALEITVKPATVSPADDLFLQVNLLRTAEFRVHGAKASPVASSTVAFYPPALPGVERTFVVTMSMAGRKTELAEPLTAVVTLIPGHPKRKLSPSSIEVVNARLR